MKNTKFFEGLDYPVFTLRISTIIQSTQTRRGSQADYGTGLENRHLERDHGFESHPLRHYELPVSLEPDMTWLRNYHNSPQSALRTLRMHKSEIFLCVLCGFK